MRICLFADAQSIHIQQLAPGLVALGHEVHVVTHKPADVPGATVERFRVPQPGLTNARRWRGRLNHYLGGFLREFDVVNIHFLCDWGFDFERLPERRAAIVATAWGSDIVNPPGETPASTELVRLRRTLLQRCDAATACGPTFARTVADFAGLGVDPVEVLPFGVDLSIFRIEQRLGGEATGGPRIGFFKGFRAVYGPTVLLRAIPLILRQLPNARFDLVGEGAELENCRLLSRELGVDESIQWLPRQPHGRLPQLLSRWDMTAIPSLHEAFAVAALESSAMGVPVVASDVCGLRDTVIHGETGLRVPPMDPAALADAIVELWRDADLRARMARAGREMVEQNYAWPALHRRWAEAYERVREASAAMV